MKKVMVLLLCGMLIVIIASSGPVFAAENNLEETISSEKYRVAEVPELRETNADTYLLSNGTYECVVYAEDKYYRDENGNLVEINNTIVPAEFKRETNAYSYANTANSTKVYFSDTQPAVLITSGTNELAFSLVGSKDVNVAVGAKGNSYDFKDFDLQSDNCITYADVFNGTDLVYSVNNGYLKEYFVLSNASAPTEFQFQFDTKNCYIKENDAGTLDVYNSSRDLLFEFGALFAVDSAGNYTDALKYEISEVFKDTTIVSVSIDSDYLNDLGRVFPVLIDPSIMVTGDTSTYDTYVSSHYPTTNYYLYNWLHTGRDDSYYIRRTYIKFDLPSGIQSNGITSAYINLKYYSGSVPSIKAYRTTGSWASSSLTWNNKPSYTTTNASANAALYSDNWYRMYVTSIVKSWYAGTFSNYGFVLKDATESGTSQWTTFYSSDAASPNKPELHINYVYYGTRPYQSTNRDDINCMGYALEYASYISGPMLNLSLNEMKGKTTAQLQTYLAEKAESWMTTNLGASNYGVISNYNSDINTGWYRIILRVGFVDADGDGVYDINEIFDYHWWYQTNTGDWADKLGSLPSQYRNNTYNVNPANQTWQNGILYYNSAGKFYQVNDIRTVSW